MLEKKFTFHYVQSVPYTAKKNYNKAQVITANLL